MNNNAPEEKKANDCETQLDEGVIIWNRNDNKREGSVKHAQSVMGLATYEERLFASWTFDEIKVWSRYKGISHQFKYSKK